MRGVCVRSKAYVGEFRRAGEPWVSCTPSMHVAKQCFALLQKKAVLKEYRGEAGL